MLREGDYVGKRIRMLCRQCGYSKTICTGSGLLSRNAKMISIILNNEEEKKQWKMIQESNDLIKMRSYQKIGYCAECEDLKTLVCVEAIDYEDNKIELFGKCNHCKGELVKKEEDEQIPCPKCGNIVLQKINAGIWD